MSLEAVGSRGYSFAFRTEVSTDGPRGQDPGPLAVPTPGSGDAQILASRNLPVTHLDPFVRWMAPLTHFLSHCIHLGPSTRHFPSLNLNVATPRRLPSFLT